MKLLGASRHALRVLTTPLSPEYVQPDAHRALSKRVGARQYVGWLRMVLSQDGSRAHFRMPPRGHALCVRSERKRGAHGDAEVIDRLAP